MTRRSNGHFSGHTRNMSRHHKPSQVATSSLIKSFDVGDRVAIVPKGNVYNAPHPRYRGRTGTIMGKRGSAYMIRVRIMSADRTLIVPSLHLEKV
ncbi:hypothetical protein M1397_01760 [Candidatus Marsarchaeota archaeon]|nr:hypothetical protein [Candidatus Marsarchaeota archaeon]